MADTKRNSLAGKVATPKPAGGAASPAPQPMMDTLEALGRAIGARIKLTTAAPHSATYEGSLFTACPVLNVVILNTAAPTSSEPAQKAGDYHIIPMSRIQTFSVISLAAGAPSPGDEAFANAQPPIGPVDVKRLKERERARIETLKEDRRNLGQGVTREAQAIYDSFRRINTPIRWHGQDMIVHDAVIISPPYRVEDCRGPRDKQETLARVRKVLEGERGKLREKGERAASGGLEQVRKGG